MSIPNRLILSGRCVIQWWYSYVCRRNITGSPGLFDYLGTELLGTVSIKDNNDKVIWKMFFNVQHILLYQIGIRARCIPHNSIQKMTSVDDCRNSAWMRQLSCCPNKGCDLNLLLLLYSWTLHQRGKGHEIAKSILSQVIADLKISMNLVENVLLIDNQLVIHPVL